MKAFVIKPKSDSEIIFISDLLKKLGISFSLLEGDDLEHIGMTTLMKEVDRIKKVSRDTIMKKLKS